eukprot:1346539-Amorphochlora_amoeboformis.AAC.1
MVSVIDGDNFVLSLIVTIVIQLIFYAFAVAFATENLYDFAGGLNYVIVFVLTIGLNDGRPDTNLKWLPPERAWKCSKYSISFPNLTYLSLPRR